MAAILEHSNSSKCCARSLRNRCSC